MPSLTAEIPRPNRWAVPFSTEMSDADIDRLLEQEPFVRLDSTRFRTPLTLRAILQNDSRIVRYEAGEVIVEEGQWGTSAFLVLSGRARVDVSGSDARLLRHSTDSRRPRRQKLWPSLARLWSRPAPPEVRDPSCYQQGAAQQLDAEAGPPRICLQDVPAVLSEHRTALLLPGELFGELAALSRFPRTATIFAETATELLEIRWQGLRDILRRDDRLRAHIDQLFRTRALAAFLRRCPLFQQLHDAQLKQLCHEAELKTFGRYDRAGSLQRLAAAGALTDLSGEPVMAAEGTVAEGLFLIRSGLARLSHGWQRGHRTVGYLAPGRDFALREVAQMCLTQRPVALPHSLRAIGFVTAVFVPLNSVTQWVSAMVLKQIAGGQSQSGQPTPRLPLPADKATARLDSPMLEFLVENRLPNGTAAMVIDLDRCTRCDDCVRACAAVHDDNPRFRRRGLVHDSLMFTQACLQCADPVCMIECPTGAIARGVADGSVMINERTCIGCSACAKNCPYDAIQMVEIRGPGGQPIRDSETHAPVRKATKCDMCRDQLGGPACQTACPHKALVRLDLTQSSQLDNWLQR